MRCGRRAGSFDSLRWLRMTIILGSVNRREMKIFYGQGGFEVGYLRDQLNSMPAMMVRPCRGTWGISW